MNKYLIIKKEVKEALENNIPVVALESTIISHGMPYPDNYKTALECEQIIRDNGCIPATIACINGYMHVGLEHEEIEYLAKKGHDVVKTSRRDLPIVIAKKLDGATTVATTMLIAALAGVKVFATGGIGGVHRGVEETMDISADLEELANTDVAVVCAGAKAILDLPRTLEYLETKGVLVLGYQTNCLPAFYTRTSPYKLHYRMDTPLEIAEALYTKTAMGLKGGVLITNPIPEEYSLDDEVMNNAIEQAIKEMNEQNIIGKDTTPFLLKRITELTGGESLSSNIKLVYNNCLLASLVSKELSNLKKGN